MSVIHTGGWIIQDIQRTISLNIIQYPRVYPEGWVTEEGRDSTLEYRLSIFHAVEDDTGKYTCITPARYEHTVSVIVKVSGSSPLKARERRDFRVSVWCYYLDNIIFEINTETEILTALTY